MFQAPDFSIKDGKIYTQEVIDSDKLGGAIYPGEERSFSFKIRLVGKVGDAKIAKATLSYQPKDLSARYEFDHNFHHDHARRAVEPRHGPFIDRGSEQGFPFQNKLSFQCRLAAVRSAG